MRRAASASDATSDTENEALPETFKTALNDGTVVNDLLNPPAGASKKVPKAFRVTEMPDEQIDEVVDSVVDTVCVGHKCKLKDKKTLDAIKKRLKTDEGRKEADGVLAAFARWLPKGKRIMNVANFLRDSVVVCIGFYFVIEVGPVGTMNLFDLLGLTPHIATINLLPLAVIIYISWFRGGLKAARKYFRW